MLPGNGMDGVVGLKDNKIVTACYTYIAANAPTCWLEWVVADKDYKESDKYDIIIGMINYTSDILKEAGYAYIFAMTTNKQLETLYVNSGFINTETEGVELIKTL